MADERAGDSEKRGGSDPSREGNRDDNQSRRGGRHRGFRGRHSAADASPGGGGKGQPTNPGRGGSQQREAEDEAQRSRPAKPEDAREMPVCSICGKAVYDLSTAISASREAGEPAHFDCVLERVIASESLASGKSSST